MSRAIADSAPIPEVEQVQGADHDTMSATQKSHPVIGMALLLCHCYITNLSMATAFNVLVRQLLQESLAHTYAMGHDHTRIPGHRLTHQAHPFLAEADVPLGQVLTD